MKKGKRGGSRPKKLGFAKANWSKHRLHENKAKGIPTPMGGQPGWKRKG
jgi:hypothetical protein